MKFRERWRKSSKRASGRDKNQGCEDFRRDGSQFFEEISSQPSDRYSETERSDYDKYHRRTLYRTLSFVEGGIMWVHLELALLSCGVLLVPVSSCAQEHSATQSSSVRDIRTTVVNAKLKVSPEALSATIIKVKDKSL